MRFIPWVRRVVPAHPRPTATRLRVDTLEDRVTPAAVGPNDLVALARQIAFNNQFVTSTAANLSAVKANPAVATQVAQVTRVIADQSDSLVSILADTRQALKDGIVAQVAQLQAGAAAVVQQTAATAGQQIAQIDQASAALTAAQASGPEGAYLQALKSQIAVGAQQTEKRYVDIIGNQVGTILNTYIGADTWIGQVSTQNAYNSQVGRAITVQTGPNTFATLIPSAPASGGSTPTTQQGSGGSSGGGGSGSGGQQTGVYYFALIILPGATTPTQAGSFSTAAEAAAYGQKLAPQVKGTYVGTGSAPVGK